MKLNESIFLLIVIMVIGSCKQNQTEIIYEPTWESLKQVDPVPEWFKDAKFGIYFHWGVYSVPAFGNEWYPKNMYSEDAKEHQHHINTYGKPEAWPYHYFIVGSEDKQGNFVQFAPRLKSEGGAFDPGEWADLFARAGAKFAGPVAEHHDGFSMWASKVNPWNAKDQAPGMDLVGLLTQAIRARDMRVILSMHHAYNFTGFYEHVPETTDPDLQILYGQLGREKNEAIWLAKHKEIIDNYKPDIIWQDFNLTAISEHVLLEFLAYYYNRANKWGKKVVTTYKDALNTEIALLDYERGGPYQLKDYYWLTDDAISRSSWCYTEGIEYYSATAVLHSLFDRISKNGNLLLNISPKSDGSIPSEQKDILMAMGSWLSRFGEAVYGTRAWLKYGEGPTEMGSGHPHGEGASFSRPVEGTPRDLRFTRSKDNSTLYIIFMGWPEDHQLSIKTFARDSIELEGTLEEVALLGDQKGTYLPVSYIQEQAAMHFALPQKPSEEMAYVLKCSFRNEIPALSVNSQD
ncbi:MAG: alpha-L-fucosidase [Candidatus Cyclobacteriaceae bacterium M3_2C_046]